VFDSDATYRLLSRRDGDWVRTVTFEYELSARSIEHVASLVERMPNVEAAIEVPTGLESLPCVLAPSADAAVMRGLRALAAQLPRQLMRIEIARAPSAAKPAPNELAQAIAALAEARARCDELREENAKQRAQLMRLDSQAREALGAGDWELVGEAARRVATERNTAQALLEEALRVQDAIWDAVGGQREGETLVDAVRRAVGMKQQSSERVAATKPERVEVGQWWACCYEDYGTWCPFRVARTNEIAAFGRSLAGVEHSGMLDAMLRDQRWIYLGDGEQPIDPVLRALENAPLDDEPETDEERDAMKHAGESVLRTSHAATVTLDESARGVTITAPAHWSLGDVFRAIRSRPALRVAFDAEVRRAADEAREAGRAEAQAVIDGLRGEIKRTFEALGAEPTPGIALDVEARQRVAHTVAHVKRLEEQVRALRTASLDDQASAYQRGQQEMRERAVVEVAEWWPALAARVQALPIAKTPTVSAGEEPGEAGPGCGGTETAGAVESVAREEASAAEIARLRSDVETLRAQLAKVRHARSKAEDELKAIDEALLSAGVTQHADESLADMVRRALDDREIRAASDGRVPRVGDVVLFKRECGEMPAFITKVREEGTFDMWTTSQLQPFLFGVPRSSFRFRD
jgi:hypothetical protein